jgi:polysaccharide pyruvyl transferase WcaK-like protein
VATRYHNVMCALKLCKPTIALGYSRKFISLMADMDLAEFNQFADSVDLGLLTEQFTELESRRSQIQQKMMERNAANVKTLEDQFSLLSSLLLPAGNTRLRKAESNLAR